MAAIVGALPTAITVGRGIWKIISSLIHRQAPIAEAALGPGTGAAKQQQVFNSIMAALQALAAAGAIDKNLPADQEILAAISAVVESMKASGLLQDAPPVTGTAPQSIRLPAGASITITAG